MKIDHNPVRFSCTTWHCTMVARVCAARWAACQKRRKQTAGNKSKAQPTPWGPVTVFAPQTLHCQDCGTGKMLYRLCAPTAQARYHDIMERKRDQIYDIIKAFDYETWWLMAQEGLHNNKWR